MIWKDVVGYEGFYKVSNTGLVRSIDRYVNNNGTQVKRKGLILRSSINPSGYEVVNLHKNGSKIQAFVHKLVAEAFIVNSMNKKEVNHIDHVKLNNNVENLEWCTRKENMMSMVKFYNKTPKIKKCEIVDCVNIITSKASKCEKCSKLHSRKVERPSMEELLKLIKNTSFVKIGKFYGVSDNSVRKWCKSYGLPFRKSEISKLK